MIHLLTLIDDKYMTHYFLDFNTKYIWYLDNISHIELSTYNDDYYSLDIDDIPKPDISSFLINEQGCVYYYDKIEKNISQLLKDAIMMKILNSI